jgi:hypothetical protein
MWMEKKLEPPYEHCIEKECADLWKGHNQGLPNREPAGFLNRKKQTSIPIGGFYQVW